MIKVMNVISDTNIGGAGHVIVNYLKHTDKENFETCVVLPTGSLLIPKLKPFGIKVIEVDGMADKSLDFGVIKKLKKIIKAENPQIIHAHGSMSGRIAGKQCHKKVVYTRHSVFPVSPKIKKGPGHLANKIINEHYADAIIAVSPAAKENLTDGGINEKYISIIMNGVNAVPPITEDKRNEARAKFGCENDDFVFGIPARIEHYKGHKTIIKAACILKEKGLKFKVLIAGTGTYVDEVKKSIEEHNIGDYVKMLGFVEDMPTLLGSLDTQINASYATEATSLSLLEGMSAGLPTVASDYGGNPYIVRDDINGYIFKAQNSKEMADKMLKIASDKEKLAEFSKNAKEIYQNEFTGEIFAANTEKVYYSLLKGDKR